MNMRKTFLFLFFVLLAAPRCAEAQTMLLHVDRAVDSLPQRHGQNLPRFSQLYAQGGFVAGPDEAGARIKYGNSMDFAIGFRTKYKLSGFYSLGWELELRGILYRLVQDSGKVVPNTLLNERELLSVSVVQVGIYQRFNFDPKRGNHMGTYLDLGASAGYQVMQNILRNKLPDGSVANSSITKVPYDNNLSLRLNVRLGHGHAALYGSWVLTDQFKSSYGFPELPRLTVGLELGLYQ
jgi:hypothetical protein